MTSSSLTVDCWNPQLVWLQTVTPRSFNERVNMESRCGNLEMFRWKQWQEHWKSHWYLSHGSHGEIDFYNIAHLLELNSSSSKIQQSQSSNLLLAGFCRPIIPWLRQCLLILWYDDMKIFMMDIWFLGIEPASSLRGAFVSIGLRCWTTSLWRFKVFVLRTWP